jgi:hypothetical protein
MVLLALAARLGNVEPLSIAMMRGRKRFTLGSTLDMCCDFLFQDKRLV